VSEPRPWKPRTTLVGAAFVALAVLTASCGGGDADDEDARPLSAPPRVSVAGGEQVVTLSAQEVGRCGLAVEALTATTRQAEAAAYGSVLDLTDLAEERGALAAAQTRVEKAQAAVAASRRERERVRTLQADNQNASERSLESATAVWQADEAEARGAQLALASLRVTLAQRWGATIGGWLERSSPELDRLLGQKERLVLLSVPSGSAVGVPPATVYLKTEAAIAATARLVSPAPRSDPHLQGPAFFYAAASEAGLSPGMTVTAAFASGPAETGVLLPRSSVVWWQGKAWVYLEAAPGRYVRREVAHGVASDEGMFVTSGISAGERVVVRGAQALLSEEQRGSVKGAEG
jgi:hypothetical protein